MTVRVLLAATFAAALFIAACSNNNGASGSACGSGAGEIPCGTPAKASAGPTPTIRHVVIMIQENRSFDNFFATYPGADGTTTGKTHDGKTVPLTKADLQGRQDIDHSWNAFVTEYDRGKMDGFDSIGFGADGGQGPAGLYPLQYVDPAEISPYWAMAQQYVLADHLFETQSSGSFIGHQDLIAGSTAINATQSLVNYPTETPWGCDAATHTKTSLIATGRRFLPQQGPFPCLDYPTLRDTLDAGNVPWRYYAPPFNPRSIGWIWSAFDAIRAVRYGPEWKTNISSPETNIFSDIAQHKLPAVSWVIPDRSNSDHPRLSKNGPSWVAQVVNAIGKSRAWDSTVIIVVWDDWGGFYDHVKPTQVDYQGLGFRVPMLIVSPYAKKGYVSHTQYEFGSILRFIEDNWKLKRIGTTDVRAKSIADVFDFTKPPRPFVPIDAPVSQSFFEHARPSYLPVDDQ